MIVTWDAGYAALPTGSLRIGLIDNTIRDLAYAIRERMEVEHEWGPGSTINDGSHILGGTSVMDTGDLTAMNAITNMQQGSLFLLNTGTDLSVMIYYAGHWVALSTVDHNVLTGRTDNDHPQYVLKNNGKMTAPLDMATFMVIGPTEDETFSGLVLTKHKTLSHALLGDFRAITANTITGKKLKTGRSIISTTVSPNSQYTYTPQRYEFFPGLYQLTNTGDLAFLKNKDLHSFYISAIIGAIPIVLEREWISL